MRPPYYPSKYPYGPAEYEPYGYEKPSRTPSRDAGQARGAPSGRPEYGYRDTDSTLPTAFGDVRDAGYGDAGYEAGSARGGNYQAPYGPTEFEGAVGGVDDPYGVRRGSAGYEPEGDEFGVRRGSAGYEEPGSARGGNYYAPRHPTYQRRGPGQISLGNFGVGGWGPSVEPPYMGLDGPLWGQQQQGQDQPNFNFQPDGPYWGQQQQQEPPMDFGIGGPWWGQQEGGGPEEVGLDFVGAPYQQPGIGQNTGYGGEAASLGFSEKQYLNSDGELWANPMEKQYLTAGGELTASRKKVKAAQEAADKEIRDRAQEFYAFRQSRPDMALKPKLTVDSVAVANKEARIEREMSRNPIYQKLRRQGYTISAAANLAQGFGGEAAAEGMSAEDRAFLGI